jgi:DNA polymerase I-like protein with 3'-5' exonuclease and polymerase domains
VTKDRFDVSTDDFLLKMDLSNPDVEWFMPSEFPDLTRHTLMAIDLETRDPQLTEMGPGWATKNGEIIGIAVAAGDFSGYFPIAHANGPNLDKKLTLRWLQKQLATPHMTKVMHNASYDTGWLMAEGVNIQGPIIDTMLSAPLLDENRMSYRLDLLGKDYLGMRKDEKVLRQAAAEWGIDPKSEMWKLPARYVGVYAEADAVLTLKLWERFKPMLEDQSLMSVLTLEHRVLPAVIEMRMRGVKVDLDKAEQAKKELRKRANEMSDWIGKESGVKVDPWSAASVQKMFDALGLEYPRTEAGAPSFTKQFLQAMEHPVAKALVTLREMDKADSTFIDSILRYQKNGRIHCEMHQLRSDDGGTVTGRFCVSKDTLIETERGPVRIVDVKPKRDRALTHRGRYRTIKHLIYKGEEEMVALRVSSGMVVKCTRNHRVLTPTGWTSVGALKLGQEVYSVGFKEGLGEQGAVPAGRHVLPVGGKANDKKSGKPLWGVIPHRSGDAGGSAVGRGAQAGSVVEVLTLEARGEKPHAWEDRSFSPPVQGSAGVRSARVRTGLETRLVYGETRFEACVRASAGYGRTAWSYGGSGEHAGASYQRGSSGQLSGQLGSGDTCGAQNTALTVTVEAVDLVGVAQVWDIEVEGDHSYIAHGLIHHNSSSNPNLQQIPARDPYIKKIIRGLFVPEDGCRWGSFDYSSQEPRLLVHFAASHPDTERDPLVKSIVEEYQRGDADLHQMVADMAGISRKAAKTINLGIMYGMGVGKLANQLGLSDVQAKALMAEYQEKVPFVKKLATLASARAEREGRIRTILGRLCRFDLWEPATFGYNKPMKYDDAQREYGGMGRLRRAFTYKALNRVIQGSAADQNKLAMAECYEEGLVPLLTVHDELCFNVESDEQATRITKIMEEGLSLKVPSKVDQELGNNWGEVG